MIKVFEPRLSTKDKLSVLSSLNKSNISGSSEEVLKFESYLARTFDRKFAVALTNGTTALEVAVKSLDFNEGDEIIVPSFTIISCLSAIIRNGLTPVFCDVDPITWNMNIDNVKRVTTKKTKGVLMVHTYGLPADATNIKNFCDDNNLKLIEDTAEAHGQLEKRKKCGSFGDVSTLSFYANKHITTGEGGAVLTDSQELYDLMKQIINLDFKEPNRFNHKNFYWNYRISGIQASLGISQINSLNKTINLKIKQGEAYNQLFKSHTDFLQIPLSNVNESKNHYWVYGLVLKKQNHRDKLMKYLFENDIQTRQFFWPLHMQDSLPKKYRSINENLSSAEYIGKNGLYIPIGPHLNLSKQKYVAKQIINYIDNSIVGKE